MEIRPIRNDVDHRAALQEIARLWDFPDDSPENDRLDVLATLVAAYEKTRWPIDRASPHDILEYAVNELGHTQSELASALGSRSLASELLAGKKRISLDAARKISAAWAIPIQLLVADERVSPQNANPATTETRKKTSARIRDHTRMELSRNYGLRLDRATVDIFRATGPGWETRINDVLVAAAKKLERQRETAG